MRRSSTRSLPTMALSLIMTMLCLFAPYVSAEEESTISDTDDQLIITSIEVNFPISEDSDEQCSKWADEGECDANESFMLKNCATSCATVGSHNKGTAEIYNGEDAAVSAFRFAEEFGHLYQNEDQNGMPISKVIEIHAILQKKIDEEHNEYQPSKEITHCGSKKCSAGKLWKRAESFRKEDMHDAAGADLIRALSRTGIEVDFQEKCKNMLQWALQSVRRQRDREARQAEAEALLEERRQEERVAMAEAEKRQMEYESSFVSFGEQLLIKREQSRGSSEATINADGTADATEEQTELGYDPNILHSAIDAYTTDGPQGGNCNKVLSLIKKIPPSGKSIDILLIEARCHELEGSHKQAVSAAGKLIAKAANYDPWLNGSPRMMAATLGANAAMQLGLSENALSFYQTVLKFDPEQERARKQYRGLKKVLKLLDKSEEQIQKGYNNKASEFVDSCLSAMRGLDVDSPLFRSKIQLKQCTIQSAMGKHEEALSNCDTAVELRLANDSIVSPNSRKEAHLVRAEALLLDMDYDEAVNDFRAAFDLVPDDKEHMEERHELHSKLQQAQHQQQRWNGGEKDYHFNENTGYPDGRPPERDHAKILQLPIDLDQRSRDIKCAWLKKQFKVLVRQYHPDKYKGNKKRAARKFKEVKEAKEIIAKEWDC